MPTQAPSLDYLSRASTGGGPNNASPSMSGFRTMLQVEKNNVDRAARGQRGTPPLDLPRDQRVRGQSFRGKNHGSTTTRMPMRVSRAEGWNLLR
jgi:hypothetical protein